MVVAKLYWGDAREKVCDVVGDLKLDANASSFAGSSNSKVFGHFVGLAFPREIVSSHPGLWFYACRYVVEPIHVQLNLTSYIIEVNANGQFVELLRWLVLLTSIRIWNFGSEINGVETSLQRWQIIKDVSNANFRHIILENILNKDVLNLCLIQLYLIIILYFK